MCDNEINFRLVKLVCKDRWDILILAGYPSNSRLRIKPEDDTKKGSTYEEQFDIYLRGYVAKELIRALWLLQLL